MLKALLLLLLVASGFAIPSMFALSHSASGISGDPAGFVLLSPNFYDSIPIPVPSGMSVHFQVVSSAPVNVYFMNSAQFAAFSRSGSTQSIYSSSGDNVSSTVGPLSAGTYYLTVNNDISGVPVTLNYFYSLEPVNVYSFHSSLPAPIGIADYGVLNVSGDLYPYRVSYRRIDGYAEIYSMKAYNPSPPAGISQYGASLQLNSVLQVNTTSGTQVYWLQNSPTFITSSNVMSYVDNVWNLSSITSVLTNSSITGRGAVTLSNGNYVYTYGTGNISYSLPLHLHLVTAFTEGGKGIEVGFGYVSSGAIHWYDNVTIHESGSAGLLVSGYSTTPQGAFYDAELVFGGEGEGEATNFTEMNSTLLMTYTLKNGTVVLPKMEYGFGSDTAEAADDLQAFMSDGRAVVEVGSGNFEPLAPHYTGLYRVTFIESGLPAGTMWSVAFDGTKETTTNETLTFSNITPGLHSYSAASVSPGFSPVNSSGLVNVTGATTVSVPFREQGYSLLPFSSSILYGVIGAALAAAVLIAVVKRGNRANEEQPAPAETPEGVQCASAQ